MNLGWHPSMGCLLTHQTARKACRYTAPYSQSATDILLPIATLKYIRSITSPEDIQHPPRRLNIPMNQSKSLATRCAILPFQDELANAPLYSILTILDVHVLQASASQLGHLKPPSTTLKQNTQ
jgi:hypothetical protein